MAHTDHAPPSEVVTIVERLLAQTYGGPIQLGQGQDLGGSRRSHVYRFPVLDGSGKLASSVIVKQANLATTNTWSELHTRRSMLFNDWAAVQFLSQHFPEAELAPRFYAGDQAHTLFIMEDLGQGERLDHLLLGSDATAAKAALIDYAMTHGRLHSLTRGGEDDYNTIRQKLGSTERLYNYTEGPQSLCKLAEVLAVPISHTAEQELVQLLTILEQSEQFRVLIQADACPDNIISVNGRWRMLDFEAATYANALLEGVYGLVPFPTCWCLYRIPQKIVLKMLNAYRGELVKGCPAAADDAAFCQALTAACLFWAGEFSRFVPFAHVLEQERKIIALSDRQRYLLIFDNLVNILQTYGRQSVLTDVIQMLAQTLHRCWPEIQDIPYYPAFQQQSSRYDDTSDVCV